MADKLSALTITLVFIACFSTTPANAGTPRGHWENQTGRTGLPGNRTLLVTPVNMDGNRITYQIRIEKNKSSVFQTRVLLKNHNSITIGGPQYKERCSLNRYFGFVLFFPKKGGSLLI